MPAARRPSAQIERLDYPIPIEGAAIDGTLGSEGSEVPEGSVYAHSFTAALYADDSGLNDELAFSCSRPPETTVTPGKSLTPWLRTQAVNAWASRSRLAESVALGRADASEDDEREESPVVVLVLALAVVFVLVDVAEFEDAAALAPQAASASRGSAVSSAAAAPTTLGRRR